jgi:O-antigen ligase
VWKLHPALSAQGFQRSRVAETPSAILVSACLFVATFLVTRQAQMPAINGLAAPWALLTVILYLRWQPALLSLAPVLLYSGLSALASLLLGYDTANVFRFFAITMGTMLAFHFRPAAISARWTLFPIAAQAALVTGVSLGLAVLQDPDIAMAVRGVAMEGAWGDIYSFDGIYYRVQVIGNALIPLLFLISVWRYRYGRFYRLMTILSLLGLVAAGNLTYFVVVGLAVLIRGWRLILRSAVARVLIVVVTGVVIVFAWTAVDEVLERKFEGSDSSMGVRFDQLEAASGYMGESPSHLLFGAGLGANFPNGKERNYSEYQYIELQALYLFLQLGLIGTAIYLATLVVSARQFLSSDGRCIFWLYMLSGATNPYILDTNQIIATVLLICLFPNSLGLPRQHSSDSPAHAVAAIP